MILRKNINFYFKKNNVIKKTFKDEFKIYLNNFFQENNIHGKYRLKFQISQILYDRIYVHFVPELITEFIPIEIKEPPQDFLDCKITLGKEVKAYEFYVEWGEEFNKIFSII